MTYDDCEYAWQKGGQLMGISSSSFEAAYKYDYTGLRASKTVDNVTTKFLWVGDLLMSQSNGLNTINWSFGPNGIAVGFTLNGVPYFYLRNIQGDVVGIYDLDGNVVVCYTYDAWGNLLSITGSGAATVGELNPIRYRGYYYDSETGYYYCQSRYYNPEWCRWISTDVYMDTHDGVLGTNMYAYCGNDPVDLADPSGMSSAWDRAGLRWPGEIHKAVQARIYANSGYTIIPEVSVSIKGSTNFRADLRRGMEIWKIKPANTKSTNNYNKGKKQLETYIKRGRDATEGFKQYFDKGGAIPGDSFYLYSTLGFGYEVWYWYAGEGVVQYDFRRVEVSEGFLKAAVYLTMGAWVFTAAAAILSGMAPPEMPPLPA